MRAVTLIFILLLILACHNKGHPNSSRETKEVNKDVSSMMNQISEDLSAKGPVVWLQYFDSSAHFFMVNNGSMVFPDFESGKRFIIDTLVKMVQNVRLTFNDVQIDSFSENAASVSAGYHEETKDMSGNDHIYNGYFTGLAVLTDRGWKLRNLHWSE
jgi:hypothetical protein